MHDVQTIFNLDIETDEIALDAIRYIWDSLSEKINDNYIGTLEIPFTAKLAVQKINKIVSLATSPHDGNIVQLKLAQKNASDEFLEFMEPDYEPSPSVIDTWARGVGLHYKSYWRIYSLLNFDIGDSEHQKNCY